MFHDKIKSKTHKIKNENNLVDLSVRKVDKTMSKYGVPEYKIEDWGDVIVSTVFSNWKISTDEDENIIYLHHENERLARKGNYRSKYHIHNVFYDLDYCVKSIVEHENFKKGITTGRKYMGIPPSV